MPVGRQMAGERCSTVSQPLWQLAIAIRIVTAKITTVAAKELVTTDTRQDDFHVLPRKFRYQKGRYERRIR